MDSILRLDLGHETDTIYQHQVNVIGSQQYLFNISLAGIVPIFLVVGKFLRT
jgi:hypothetical protein